MRAHVDQRIDLGHVSQPQAESEQRMARRQRRIVIVGAPLARAAAIGRKRDQNIAEAARAEPERAVAQVGIGRGLAPGGCERLRRRRPAGAASSRA